MTKSRNQTTPLLDRLVRALVGERYGEAFAGDLLEIVRAKKGGANKIISLIRLLVLLLASLVPYVCNEFYWRTQMLFNYLKTAFRNMNKNRIFGFINIAGLAVGICCCLLIFMYITDEMSFDRFHTQKDTVYRVLGSLHLGSDGTSSKSPSLPMAIGPLIVDYFSEIDDTIRFARESGTVSRGNIIANETVTFTDPTVFQAFSFPLLKGRPDSVLREAHSLVLTESAAAKYFGRANPMGERLTITFGNTPLDFIVTGVAADVPRNSTIQFTLLVPALHLPAVSYEDALTTLGDFSHPVFIRLKDGTNPELIEARLEAFVSQTFAGVFKEWEKNNLTESRKSPVSLELQRLKDMHFGKDSEGTDPAGVLLLGTVGFVILLIAVINFINLSIGRAGIRLKEIGMRKVIGATRKQLIQQFWTESAVLTAFSLLLGILLAVFFLPTFGRLSGKILQMSDFLHPVNMAGMAALLLLTALGAGSYPALVLSGVNPAHIFRGKFGLSSRSGLQKILVVLQFALSVFLIVTTLFLGRQIRYMATKNPGYTKDGLVAVQIQVLLSDESQVLVDRFRDRVRSLPQVQSVSAASTTFGRGTSRFPLEIQGERFDIYQIRVDADYLKTVGIELVQGRDFSRERTGDTAIINEEFLRLLGTDDPLGRRIGEFAEGPDDKYPNKLQIIGVMKNIHNLSFKHGLQPMMLHMQPGWGMGNMLVRIQRDSVSDTMSLLEKAWREIRPDKPFLFSFTEDDLDSQYRAEKKWSSVVHYSSLFAMIISCMGIFGLTTLAVNRRFREIGIRKVLGAGVFQILRLITFEFLLLIGIANLTAWPAAYLVTDRILKAYHYRIAIGPSFFLLAFVLTLSVALGTIGALALKASLSDPVKALRYE